MPDSRHLSHHPGTPVEDRFLSWVDELVDPATGAAPEPDADFEEIAGTATVVQRTAETDSVTSLSADRADAIWEDIMTTTTPSPTPTLPASGNAPPIQPRRLVTIPSPGWHSYLATALLIAAIVVAGLATAWRIAGPFDLGGNKPNRANQPGIAGSATPAAPPATPVAEMAACDLTSDMLVFTGDVPERVENLDITYAVIEPHGDFVIQCDGVDNAEPLLTGVTDAASLGWPGTVVLELAGGNAIAYNIATGAMIDFSDFETASRSVNSPPGSPWIITPVGPDVQITNLRTMHSSKLAAAAGGSIPDGYSPVLVSNPGSSIAVITNSTTTIDTDGMRRADEMPGTVYVVDETFETRRWIDSIGQVAVGEDAIAYQTQIDGQPTIRVEDAETGDAMFDVGPINSLGSPGQNFTFAGDGETLVYLHGGQLWLAPNLNGVESNPPIQLIETGDIQPTAVYPTGVPGRVLVERRADENIGGPGAGGARPVSILNTVTGEVIDLEGFYPHFDPDAQNQFGSLEYFVTIAPSPDSETRTVARLTDIATGEVMLTSEPMDVSAREIVQGNNTLNTSGSGAIAVVSPPGGEAVLFDAITGTVSVIAPPMPENGGGMSDLRWKIAPSHDGAHIYAIGFPQADEEGFDIRPPSDPMQMGSFSVAPIAAEPQWSVPASSLPTAFILGVPASSEDEPQRLEAQDPVPLEATPIATPATPMARTIACDLTGDIPLATSLDDLPWSETALLLNDGTLELHCNGTSAVIAKEVADILGTTWPGAVLLQMDDGTLRGINLRTGATSDLGAFHEQVQGAFVRVTRWMPIPTSPETLDWRIVDLETMESFLLSDEIGGVLPRSTLAHLWATAPDAAVIAFGGTPVLDGTPPPGTPVSTLPSEFAALVIDGSLDNRRWADTASYPSLMPASISPDGELLAIEHATDDGQRTVRVERLATGELIAETGIDYGAGDSMVVLNDGAGLLHVTEDRLDLVTWDGEITVETLISFESPQNVPLLTHTAAPGIVLAGITGPSRESIGYLIDASTGEVTKLPGLLQMPFVNVQYHDGVPNRHVMVAAPRGADETQATLRMIEVSTGEVAVESEPVDLSAEEPATLMAALPATGTAGLVFLPDGSIVVLDAGSGEAYTMPPPELDGVRQWLHFPSPDGDYLISAGGRVFVREVTPDAEWIQVPTDSGMSFVPGSAALPDAAAQGGP